MCSDYNIKVNDAQSQLLFILENHPWLADLQQVANYMRARKHC